MKLSDFIKKYGDCEVTKEMEKCINKKGKWMPARGQVYYLVGSNGSIAGNLWDGDTIDNYRRDFMRIFKTEKEAERYLEIMEACKEASFEPDWEDVTQNKYFFTYHIKCKEVKVVYRYASISGDAFFFESEEVAQSLIDRFGEKDIAKYVLGVEIED